MNLFTSSRHFSLLFNLFLYVRNMVSLKHPRIGILAHLKRALKNVSPWAYFCGFMVPCFNRNAVLTNLQSYGTCNLTNLQPNTDMLPDIFKIFSEQLVTRQLWPAAIIYKVWKTVACKKGVITNSQSSQKKSCVGLCFLMKLFSC